MLSEGISKENLDSILKELAREYRKMGGKGIKAEIVLIGGAAIIENYGFRDMTTDVDAVINAASMLREAANLVGDRFGLSSGWLNDDFKKTVSYTSRLREISKYYRCFYNVLEIRTVTAEYLIAMKLVSGRKYKNDLSDIVGILEEHFQKGDMIDYARIDQAVTILYGDWSRITAENQEFIKGLLENQAYMGIYDTIRKNERKAKEALVDFEVRYPGVTTKENVDVVIEAVSQEKVSKQALLEILRKRK